MEDGGGWKRAHVYISGKVQGVFFRDSMCRQAARLNAFGWVSNLPDGRVEAVVEGRAGAVEHLIEWCRKGPAQAVVEDVKVDYQTATGEFNGFEVF